MLTRIAVAWFGSTQALADAFGISVQAVYKWGDTVPDLKQLQIEDYTRGQLQAEERLKCVRTHDLDD